MPVEDLLTLESALSRLEAIDPRGAEIVVLRFFSGLSVPEVAEHLGIGRDDVITGLSAAAARSVGSIDASTTDDDTAIDRREAEAMVKNDPGNLVALNFVGVIKGAAGDSAAARNAYVQLLARAPGFRCWCMRW